MSEFLGVVTTIGAVKIAASIGGAALDLDVIRLGDGNGATITPAPGMTDLVRRVGLAYPIVASAADPDNAGHWRITAIVPAEDGPFDIREIGVFDGAGDMIAIARHALVEKRTLGQGAAVELTTDVVFPVSATAQITVVFAPTAYATQGWVDERYLSQETAEQDYLSKAEAAEKYMRKPAPFYFYSMM